MAPLILLLFFLAQWTVLFSDNGPTWDAAFYYSYARSIIFDGDLRIANDLRLSYPTASPDFVARELDQDTSVTGRVATPFAFGSALLWLPWLAILRAIAAIGQLFGLLPAGLTGYEWYFTIGMATLAMILGWLAFYLSYRAARWVSQRPAALLATVTILFATPLLYYMYAEPLFAHATSAFITTVFVTVWWRYFRQPFTYSGALALGALLGMAVLVRWQHAVYIVLPLSSLIVWWFALPAGQRRSQLGRAALLAICVGLGAAAVGSLQLAHWRTLYGRWLTVPQGSTFMNWAAPYWYEVLFSTFRGLLPWMPVYFLSLIGLIVGQRKHRAFMLPLLIVLLLSTYVNSSSTDWFAGGAYGPRRFTSELAILIVGYGALLQALPQRIRLAAGSLAAVALFLHQWLLLRHGLREAIGGRVLSMAPDFQWSDTSYAAFLKSLGSHVGDLNRQPLRTPNWPNTPLGLLDAGHFPSRHLALLVGTLLFLGLAWFVVGRLRDRWPAATAVHRWVLVALLAAVIILADLWLLYWA